jgi:hypothetical protein
MAERQRGCQPVQARSKGNGQRRNQVGASRNRRHLASRLGGNNPRPSRHTEGQARDHARPGHVYTAEVTPQTTDEQLRNNPMSIYVRDLLLVAPSMITRTFTMKKHLSAVILGAALRCPALALAAPGDDLADKFFSKNNPTLSAQERPPWRLPRSGTPAQASSRSPARMAPMQVRVRCAAAQHRLRGAASVRRGLAGRRASELDPPGRHGPLDGRAGHQWQRPDRSSAPHHQADGCRAGNQPGRDNEPAQLSPQAALAPHRVHAASRLHLPGRGACQVGNHQDPRARGTPRPNHPANRRIPGRSVV